MQGIPCALLPKTLQQAQWSLLSRVSVLPWLSLHQAMIATQGALAGPAGNIKVKGAGGASSPLLVNDFAVPDDIADIAIAAGGLLEGASARAAPNCVASSSSSAPRVAPCISPAAKDVMLSSDGLAKPDVKAQLSHAGGCAGDLCSLLGLTAPTKSVATSEAATFDEPFEASCGSRACHELQPLPCAPLDAQLLLHGQGPLLLGSLDESLALVASIKGVFKSDDSFSTCAALVWHFASTCIDGCLLPCDSGPSPLDAPQGPMSAIDIALEAPPSFLQTLCKGLPAVTAACLRCNDVAHFLTRSLDRRPPLACADVSLFPRGRGPQLTHICKEDLMQEMESIILKDACNDAGIDALMTDGALALLSFVGAPAEGTFIAPDGANAPASTSGLVKGDSAWAVSNCAASASCSSDVSAGASSGDLVKASCRGANSSLGSAQEPSTTSLAHLRRGAHLVSEECVAPSSHLCHQLITSIDAQWASDLQACQALRRSCQGSSLCLCVVLCSCSSERRAPAM